MSAYYANAPDVVLIKIFNYLCFQELCRIGEVCRRWYEVSRSLLSHRKRINVRDIVLTYHQLEKLVPYLNSSLNYLHICASLNKTLFLTPNVLTKVREQCPNLSILIIEGAFVAKDISMTDITLNDLPSRITTLSLRKSFFHPDQFFYRGGNQLLPANIKCLDVGHCWCIDDTDILFLSRLSLLTELYLNGCEYITKAVVVQLANVAPQLEVLDLENTKVTGDSIQVLSEFCCKLTKLFIGWTETKDSDMGLLERTPFKTLQFLCLKNTLLTDHGLYILISSQLSLKLITVSGSYITPNGVDMAFKYLPMCKVELSYCENSNARKQSCEHFLSKYYF